MSFYFFKQFRPKTPAELVKQTRDALMALDDKTVADVRLLEKALEEVDKSLLAVKQMLLGDGESDPNPELVSQLAIEACKEDFLEILVQNCQTLVGRQEKDTVQIWCALLRQKVDSDPVVLRFLELHPELLDFLISCYENKETALNCGLMLRECAHYPSLVKYMLESASFELFFKYVELPNFDIASDAFATFKELLTRHGTIVYEYLTIHYNQFFGLYERLLSSNNYVTRRQSLKLLSDFLLERHNAPVMMQYISDKRNLRTMMNLLKGTVSFYSPLLTWHRSTPYNLKIKGSDACHVRGGCKPKTSPARTRAEIFKHLRSIYLRFCSQSQEDRRYCACFSKNRDKLLKFLTDFHLDKEDEQFEEEKELLLKEIEALPVS